MRGLILITLLFAILNGFLVVQADDTSPKIIIVGAGASGISTAAKLLEHGYNNIVILEALDRIGGRVHSIPFGKGFVDLGAQWCQGEKGNVVYELVKDHFEFGDIGINNNRTHGYTSDGKLVDRSKYVKLMDLTETITYDNEKMAMFNGSVGEFFDINYPVGLLNKEFADVDKELADQIKDLTERGMNSLYSSDSWYDVSAQINAIENGAEGNQQLTWREYGSKTVFDFLTKKRPDPSKALPVDEKIQFNKEVTKIDWSSNEVVVNCADGSEYRADHVIVTVSLGFLKKHYRTLFTPQLPQKKINAIEHTGYGTLGKFFLEFAEPFWPVNDSNWAAYSFLWKQEDKSKLIGTEREWLLDVYGVIKEDAQPNLLGGLLAGKRIKQFEEISDEQLIDDSVWLLQKFLGRAIPRPINMRRNRWQSNKYFFGTYSFASMDTQRYNVTLGTDLAETLYNSANKPALLIAGEATEKDHSGYVHGAVMSGWRAATEISDYYKSKQVFIGSLGTQADDKSSKFIIVGAGASGISAAAKLLEHGYNNIVILEALDRIGGRVHSIPFGKGFVDLGAQWCQGEEGNVVYELVNDHFEFGDNGITNRNTHGHTSDGKLVDRRKYVKVMNMSHAISSNYEKMAKFNGSLGEFWDINFRIRLRRKKFQDVDDELADQIKDLSERGVNSFYASDSWYDLSARLNSIDEGAEGNQQLTWKEYGSKTVFDFLTKKRPDPSKALPVDDKIHFNKEVTKIDWSSNEVVVHCVDGSEYRADHVVVTVSLGFLKKHYRTLFTPQLPQKKINAIEHTGYGTLGKFFLEFAEPFWPTDIDEWAQYTFLWKQEDKSKLIGTEREWLLDIYGMIKEDAQPNLIGGLLAGKRIKQFEEISDEQLIDDCVWLLQKFLGPSIPRPINMRRNRWQSNKYFFGTYSFASMDTQRYNVTLGTDLAETLYNSANKPVLLIAGEATEKDHSGYVHGAVMSGWRAATEISDYYK